MAKQPNELNLGDVARCLRAEAAHHRVGRVGEVISTALLNHGFVCLKWDDNHTSMWMPTNCLEHIGDLAQLVWYAERHTTVVEEG